MEIIKWGILGPGIIANQFAHDFRYVTNGVLSAVASRSAERAGEFAKKYQIPKAYDSYQDLFQDPEIDAIYIATPHTFHYQQTLDAFDAGKAVLCEKPITTNPGDCRRLIEKSISTGNYLMEGMWTYFLPAVLKAQQWISEGRIGTIKHLKSEFGYPVPYDSQSRMYNPDLAGGSLLDMGVYTIAMAWLFLKEDPKDISVISRKAPSGVDNDVLMMLEYEDAAATLHSAFRCKLHNATFVIGDQGYITLPDFWRAKECLLYLGEECVEHFKEPRESFGFDYEIEAVSKDLLENKKESDRMPLATSQVLQEHMKEVMARFT